MPSQPRIGIAYHKNLRNTTTNIADFLRVRGSIQATLEQSSIQVLTELNVGARAVVKNVSIVCNAKVIKAVSSFLGVGQKFNLSSQFQAFLHVKITLLSLLPLKSLYFFYSWQKKITMCRGRTFYPSTN